MTTSRRAFPDQIEITPLSNVPNATVQPPGSKSITNRALVLAALASRQSTCKLSGALQSEDTEVMVQALSQLGFLIHAQHLSQGKITLEHSQGDRLIPASAGDLFLANSGTSIRFLTAMLSLGHGTYRLDGIARMRERPIADLLDALTQLGVSAISEQSTGCPPVQITSSGISGGEVSIRGDVSSQYLSGLLMAMPLADGDVTVRLQGALVSQPYVDMTIAMIRQFGGEIHQPNAQTYHIPGNQQYRCDHFAIEPDASGASYFFAAAAITEGSITVPGVSRSGLQGDAHFVDALQAMGCTVTDSGSAITVQGGPLTGIDIDMNAISDTAMTLGAVACFAKGPTHIRNIGHIRHKETDRIEAMAVELRKVGACVDEHADGLTIYPCQPEAAEIATYNDHRMAMSFALIGLKVPGIVILNPACVGKTYPGFFEDLEKLKSSSRMG